MKEKTIVSLPRKPHFALKWSLGKFLSCDSSQKSHFDFNELILFLENNYKYVNLTRVVKKSVNLRQHFM